MASSEKRWTASNLMSLSRVLLVIPIVFFVLDPSPSGRYWAILFMVIAVLTDFLDGYLARQLNQVTEFGKLIDPLSDKITVGAIAVVLVVVGYLPLWFAAAVVGRDLLILFGGLYVARTKKTILPSNQLGKWAVAAVALTVIFATLRARQFEFLVNALIGVSVLMLLISSLSYLKRFIEVLRLKPTPVRSNGIP